MRRQAELRQKLGLPGLTIREVGPLQVVSIDGHDITLGSAATDEQIAAALARSRQIRTDAATLTTPIDRLRSKFELARGVAQRVASNMESEADALIAEESAMKAKTVSAFAPHKAILGEARGELQAIEDALNLMSNGGPSLDPLPEPEPTATGSTTEPSA